MTSKPEEKTYNESLNDLEAAWLNLIMEVSRAFKIDKLMIRLFGGD